MGDTKEMVREERAELADFLGSLTPEEWEQQSLCGKWRVRDVVAHLVSLDAIPFPTMVATFVRAGPSIDPGNEALVRRLEDRTTDELVMLLEEHPEPGGVARMFPPIAHLVDAVVHQQDIRRPLGKHRDIAEERVVAVLQRLTKSNFGVPGKRLSKGLRLETTDFTWSLGRGPEVSGPGEALMMALAGRGAATDDLKGDGVEMLKGRLG
jgi:uncharacterized protein (TIGR03083 family)